MSRAWAATIFSISDGSTLSSQAWMRAAATSSGPQRMNSARVRPPGVCAAAGWTLRSRLPRPACRRPPRAPRRAAAYAGPSVSHRKAGASLVRSTSTWAPHGACDSRWRDQGVELLRRVRAGHDAHRELGARLGDQDVRGAGDAGHVDADGGDRGLGPEPWRDGAGPRPSSTPSSMSALGRNSSSVKSAPSQVAGSRRRRRRCPRRRASVDSSRASAIIASGAAPPNTPECRGCSRVRTVTMQATSPRSAVVSDGLADAEVAHVADDEQVARRRARGGPRRRARGCSRSPPSLRRSA